MVFRLDAGGQECDICMCKANATNHGRHGNESHQSNSRQEDRPRARPAEVGRSDPRLRMQGNLQGNGPDQPGSDLRAASRPTMLESPLNEPGREARPKGWVGPG